MRLSWTKRGVTLIGVIAIGASAVTGGVATAAGHHSGGGVGIGRTTTEPAVTFTTPSRPTSPSRPSPASTSTSTTGTPVTITPAVPTKPAAPSRSLTKLRKVLADDLRAAGGSSSALVVDDTTGTTLFSDKPNERRLPASVAKLYTTVTALFTLGAGAHLTTTVLGHAAAGADGAYHGALYLRGGGDPTFGDESFDRQMYGAGIGATVQALARRLRAAGIRRVSGPIVADESYFDSRRGGPNSAYRASPVLEGELSGLAYDDGFTSSSETQLQPQPALWAGEALATVMRESGIVTPKNIRVRAGTTPPGATELADVESPPLSTLIELTNSPSDDFFAETLLKDIGRQVSGHGTTAAGAAVVRNVIAQKLGIHPTLVDGSGLSRHDRTTAAEVVKLLREMRGDPAFYDSLAIAGVRGTMSEEMLGSKAMGNCRGKTGTLHDVASLVGYCTAADGDELSFAFIMNGLHNSTTGHALEDLMGEALADYRS